METKMINYYNHKLIMNRIRDHLWISFEAIRDEYIVEEFNLEKMHWTQSRYTADELENIFNLS